MINLTRSMFVWVVLGTTAVMAQTTQPSSAPPRHKLNNEAYVVKTTAQAVRDATAAPASQEWPATFFVQAAGPRTNNELGGAASKDKPWNLLRALPYPGSTQSTTSYGPRGYAVVFERALTRKWTNMFRIVDMSVPAVAVADKSERVHVELGSMDRAFTAGDMVKSFEKGGLPPMVYLPAEKQDALASEGLYFSADRWALCLYYNVGISVRPNFSDVKSSADFEEFPSSPPLPIIFAASIKRYLGQPFPKPAKILHGKRGRLLAGLSLGAAKVKSGQAVPVKITFGAAALQMPEIVRLRASHGGFQRKDGNILYKAEKPGESRIVLEAMGGGHGDGVFDFADRQELKIVIVE